MSMLLLSKTAWVKYTMMDCGSHVNQWEKTSSTITEIKGITSALLWLYACQVGIQAVKPAAVATLMLS